MRVVSMEGENGKGMRVVMLDGMVYEVLMGA
jgi:hypothetical protein